MFPRLDATSLSAASAVRSTTSSAMAQRSDATCKSPAPGHRRTAPVACRPAAAYVVPSEGSEGARDLPGGPLMTRLEERNVLSGVTGKPTTIPTEPQPGTRRDISETGT